MRRQKNVHGQANDNSVPPEELFLAKLIQNAAANKLQSCKFMRYADRNGSLLKSAAGAKFCCAQGAADLANDTMNDRMMYAGMADGNDLNDWSAYGSYKGESVGWAFREALRADKEDAKR